MYVIALLVVMHTLNSFAFIDFEIAKSFLDIKDLKFATIYNCLSSIKARHELYKKFMMSDKRVLLININKKYFVSDGLSEKNHVGVIFDGNCNKGSERYLVHFGKQQLYTSKNHFLIMGSTKTTFKTLENVDLKINADVTVIISDVNSNRTRTVYDVYNPYYGRGGTLKIQKTGFYTVDKRYQTLENKEKYLLRRNLTGVVFKSLIVLPVKFEGTLSEYLLSDENRSINTFNRFHNRLIYHCIEFYNFSLNVSLTESWGYQLPNGSFDGMVGALERKYIDFGNSPVFIRADRMDVVQYGRNTWRLRSAFVFRNPKRSTTIQTYLRPLSKYVWVLTTLAAFLIIVAMKFALRIEKIIEYYEVYAEISWSFIVLTTIGTFCQQGSQQPSSLASVRILMLSTLILSMLIYQFYSASIVSFLLMQPVTILSSLKDILWSALKLGCEDILYIRDYFLHTTDEIALKLYQTRIIVGSHNQSNFYPANVGLQKVRKGNYAFHVELATAYPIIEKTFSGPTICELREVQLLDRQMNLVLQKNSPFKDMMDFCLHRLAETGLSNRQLKYWHPRKPECIQSSSVLTFHIGIDDVFPALLLLVFGVFISLCILALELFVKRKLQKFKQAQKDKVPIYPFTN